MKNFLIILITLTIFGLLTTMVEFLAPYAILIVPVALIALTVTWWTVEVRTRERMAYEDVMSVKAWLETQKVSEMSHRHP